MKVLWLTQLSTGASNYLKENTSGRSWVASLGDIIKKDKDIQLAVCFFNNDAKDFKFHYEDITYYPIKDKLSTKFNKIKAKLFGTLWDSNLPDLLKVVDDYKPDIIQLFGTESGMGEIVGNTKVPIIIHIQGILNPYVSNWLPRGFKLNTILLYSSIYDLILRRDLYSDHLLLKKMAKREEYIIKNSKYFFGRTDWDKRIIKLFNHNSEYFHCNEALRPIMSENKWEYTNNQTLRLVSVLNPFIYKGLDIVIETANLLKNKFNIEFEWAIIGIENDNKVVKIIERTKGMKFIDNSVNFKGQKLGNDLISELLESNLFIHPSHIENSPNSVCEAMLLGMPVIAGNVGGVASLIETGQSGICYNSQDPYDLASIISEKAFDRKALKILGENAHDVASIRHDKSQIASVVKNTYQYILFKENKNNTAKTSKKESIINQ